MQTIQQNYRWLLAFIRRHWKKLLPWRQKIWLTEEALHLVLAGGIGILAASTSLFFYTCIDFVQEVFFGRHQDLVEMAEVMEWWQRLSIPILGGLGAGLILYWGLRLVGNKRPDTNLLEAVVVGDGHLPLRIGIIKSFSSLLSIASGASIGREGAITQMTATLASRFGEVVKWPPYRLRMLVACGAASGLAATYNAPVAGAIFAAQIVLGNFSMNLFAPVVFSSVIASMMSRSLFDIAPLTVPVFTFTRVSQLPWFLLLGVFCGFLAAGFLKLLRRSEQRFEGMGLPLYLKMMVGGLMVGILSIGFPQVWGNGYTVIKRILDGNFAFEPLLAVFVAKMLATLASVGCGMVGGVVTPTLFLGAGLGALFGLALQSAGLAQQLPVGVFALVGMAGMLSATTRSPLLAMVMLFEMSNYSLMPAYMLTAVVASLVVKPLHPDSIYTEPLRKKGFEPEDDTRRVGIVTSQMIGDLMRPPVAPISPTATFREITERFLTSPNNFLPVVDETQRLVGMVALQDLKQDLHESDPLNLIIASDIMRQPPSCLVPRQRLLEALPILLVSELRNVPVVNTLQEMKLIGSVPRAELLSLFSDALASSRSGPAFSHRAD